MNSHLNSAPLQNIFCMSVKISFFMKDTMCISKEMVWWGKGVKRGSIIHKLDFKI